MDGVVDLLGRTARTTLGEVGDVLRHELRRIVHVVAEHAQERHDERLLGGFLTADVGLALARLLGEPLELLVKRTQNTCSSSRAYVREYESVNKRPRPV